MLGCTCLYCVSREESRSRVCQGNSSDDLNSEEVLFSTIESKPHSERKRMLSHVYSKSHIQTSPELNAILDTITTNLQDKLTFYATEGRVFDFFRLTKSFGMDATTAYLFGLGRGTNFIQESQNRNPLEMFETGVSVDIICYYQTALPIVVGWLEKIGIKLLPKEIPTAWQSMDNLCLSMCENAKKDILNGSFDKEKGDGKSYPTVYAQLYHKLQESGVPPETLETKVAAETLDHMIAGNELIGVTLSYLVWEVSLHPEMHRRLHEEIKTCFETKRPTSETSSLLPSGQIIDSLPILDAVLQETMRLHPAGFGPFPRVVPAGGAQIEGVAVPAGTVVAASVYPLHRNAAVFPEPDDWKPERWLNASEEQRRDMLRWFWAFGSGGRMCIGNHLAVRGWFLLFCPICAFAYGANFG